MTTPLPRIMLLTGLFGALAGTLGLYAAYYVPIAPASVVVLVLLFLGSMFIAPRAPLRRGRRFARQQRAALSWP